MRKLCQNCVTYPLKPPVNTVIYEDTSTRIGAAEIADSELRWWDLVSVSTRGRMTVLDSSNIRCFADDAYHLEPVGCIRSWQIPRIDAGQAGETHTLAERIAAGPIAGSHRLVDDDDG